MRVHISAGRYQFGAGESTESGKQQVPMGTIGVIAALVIALIAVVTAYGNLTREISEGDRRVRQTVVESERVLREEIGGVRGEIQGVREEINSNYRELRDLLERSNRR